MTYRTPATIRSEGRWALPGWIRRVSQLSAILLAVSGLAACFDSVPTATQPATSVTALSYTGPSPRDQNVQAFMVNVWENIRSSNRCGSCHVRGVQSPIFAQGDNVNDAYDAALTVANLSSPADSRMVVKVAGGHNCWLGQSAGDLQTCGTLLTAYIQAWASGSGANLTQSTAIELTPPPLKDPGSSKSFPASSTLFATYLHPLLTAHCSGCHTESSPTPQAPYFANSDANSAYDAVRTSQKINLDDPAQSRLVVRLRSEFHNCWSGDCQADAQAMQDAITAMANAITPTQLDPAWKASKALNLTDGVIASGGKRYESNVIARYEFKTGSGDTAYDTSGIEPALHLKLAGTEGTDYRWVGGWGIEFVTSTAKAQGLTSASKKLADRIKASGEYSIEAWLVPGNVTQEGPARIISYSAGTTQRNFTLGQTLYTYNFLNRSSTTDANGEAALNTADADEDLQATQQHVVVTFDPVNGRKIYVNGAFTDDADTVAPGNLNSWDDTFAFVMGNEVSGDKPWAGKLRFVAIHDRALTPEQIGWNFDAGVGEKYFLLFSIAQLVNIPDTYIMFEVAQFDSYSYLFNKPTFIALNSNTQISNIPIKGVRIGLNGKEPTVGQAYRKMDTAITFNGQVLSSVGTVIALEKGPQTDEFFLTFEQIGSLTNARTEPAPLQPAALPDDPAQPDIGLRTFEEISASMSSITGVPMTNSNVKGTYDTIKQQLPTVENIGGFLSSHQMAIAQLAIEYCNALVENTGLRSAFFGSSVNLDASASAAFGTQAGRDAVINPTVSKVLGLNLSTQPSPTAVHDELNNLVVRLTSCIQSNNCAVDRTKTVAKAVCSAGLGGAAVLVQ